jgi:L-aspartate semialdehyde sulfurtransferase
LAVIGDLKQMSSKWLMGASVVGYGCSLTVGIGVPIPVLNEEILEYTTVTDADIYAQVIDYSDAYPQRKPDVVAEVTYAELKSGKVKIKGKEIPTASRSSYPKAVEIATILKQWIAEGKFQLTEPVAHLPGAESGVSFHALNERPIEY